MTLKLLGFTISTDVAENLFICRVYSAIGHPGECTYTCVCVCVCCVCCGVCVCVCVCVCVVCVCEYSTSAVQV